MADKERIALWRRTAARTRKTAYALWETGEDHRSCASRAYYAAYQALTSVSIAHGDEANFAQGRNNPSHDQMTDLIQNNGTFTLAARRRLIQLTRLLRSTREDADYRLGRTVDAATIQTALRALDSIFDLLELYDGGD